MAMTGERERKDAARAAAGLRHELPRRAAAAEAPMGVVLGLDKALNRLERAGMLDDEGDMPGRKCHLYDIMAFDPARDAVTPEQANALLLFAQAVDQARDSCHGGFGWDALEGLGAVARCDDGRWLAVTNLSGRALAETFRSATCAANLCSTNLRSNIYSHDVSEEVQRFHILDECLFGATAVSPSRALEAMADLVRKGLAWNSRTGVGIVASFLDHDGFVCATMPQVVTPTAVTRYVMDYLPDRPEDFFLWDFMDGAPSVTISRKCLETDMSLLTNGLCQEGWTTFSRDEDIVIAALASHLTRTAPDDLASRLETLHGDRRADDVEGHTPGEGDER